MALGTGYDQQACYLARALEVVGERWTLLIVRDCFFGVRRFVDLRDHLDVSRAVLTERLASLVEAGVLERDGDGAYDLTGAGRELWPVVRELTRWGERNVDAGHPARLYTHLACGAALDGADRCPACGRVPGPEELEVRPGAGHASARTDRVARVLSGPHRMLTPV